MARVAVFSPPHPTSFSGVAAAVLGASDRALHRPQESVHFTDRKAITIKTIPRASQGETRLPRARSRRQSLGRYKRPCQATLGRVRVAQGCASLHQAV